MRPYGFSTGALALSDFRAALQMLEHIPADAVELSALRENELEPLIDFARTADLSRFRYVSVHAPAKFTADAEPFIVEQLALLVHRGWPVVIHPDTIHDFTRWTLLGEHLLVENMDKRKPMGRSVDELAMVFDELPLAGMCFDIAHARQYDSSMTEAYRVLTTFNTRIRQLHISEVNTSSKHDRISITAARSFQEVASLIPQDIPVILESPVSESEMETELEHARFALETALV